MLQDIQCQKNFTQSADFNIVNCRFILNRLWVSYRKEEMVLITLSLKPNMSWHCSDYKICVVYDDQLVLMICY